MVRGKKIYKMEKNAKIFVAGHRGLVGSAILRNLKQKGFINIITRTRQELDLTKCDRVAEFFLEHQPEYVFLAAAKVGGIIANDNYRADFIYENLMIQTNIIHHSYLFKVKKLMFLGSTCIYPKVCPQPIKEEYLMRGPLEYTNEPYAIAKLAGFKMCESYNLQYGTNFLSVMPSSLYGPGDNFNLETSHVLPALIRKMHLGKVLKQDDWRSVRSDLNTRPIEGVTGNNERHEILKVLKKYGVIAKFQEPWSIESETFLEIWGTGKPLREFMWSDDLADACVYLMNNCNFSDVLDIRRSEKNIAQGITNTHINIGTGIDISIAELASIVQKSIEFKGELFFNSDKPDGTMKKLSDTSRLQALGWRHKVGLQEGVNRLYQWYLKSIEMLVDTV